jgi:CDP-glucose 4,6-dehydratase
MEELVIMFSDIYKNRKILVTGHTGFKGSWLTLWLKMLGAEVVGISLPSETSPNHWDLLALGIESSYIDIRDEDLLRRKIAEIKPEVVFHLAAQPLVRRSYRKPLETWATNVMGTANVLDACLQVNQLAAVIVVTTDKCYENKEWVWGYRENDALGGHDPYSASKAGSELVTASYRRSFYNKVASPLLASARAGNVIGGGDWSEDRLIPDMVRSVSAEASLEIRSPDATRPWQHVLECLSGYLILGQQLLTGDQSFADAWNFGPEREGNRKVRQVLETLNANWPAMKWHTNDSPQLHEAQLLHLDSGKARERLDWRPVWTFEEGVAATAEWYKAWQHGNNIISVTQIEDYAKIAKERGLIWAKDVLI